ncbi:MAG: hypothetical protein ACO3A2_02635 [Bdellovibrionia bacterium]
MEKLPHQVKGQNHEQASPTTRETLRLFTAAIFEQVLMNLSEAELQPTTSVRPQFMKT